MRDPNILSLFLERARELSNRVCWRYKRGGRWETFNWSQASEQVARFSEALRSLDVMAGDKVAILSSTRYEWTVADLAILSLKAVTVPIYSSTLAPEIRHILEHAEVKVLIVENKSQLEKIQEIQKAGKLTRLQQVISIEACESPMRSFHELIEKKLADWDSYEKRIQTIDLNSPATIVYTSGTTGMPKGVLLNHQNFMAGIETMGKMFALSYPQEGLLFLPLAHIFARGVQFFQVTQGFIHAYAESLERLVDDIGEIRPHFLVCVPRIFEKIYHKIFENAQRSSSLKKRLFFWAIEVGKRMRRLEGHREPIPSLLGFQYAIAQRLVFSKLRQKLGGRIELLVSAGAPLSIEIAEFFHAAGLLILEGYGLTETVAAVNFNRANCYRFGTVGPVTYGMEEKLAEDGEILVRGAPIFKGYYKDPEATQEAFTAEGFFRTGDIGEFDSDGFLKITDRKKNLIITSGGKNIAPQPIENWLKTDPLISEIMVFGDGRKFLSALLTLNPEELKSLARDLGLKEEGYSNLVKHPQIFSEVQKRVEEKNQQLPRYETIKRFAILACEFGIEAGELTPTLKVKRKIVTQRYQEILDSFYRE